MISSIYCSWLILNDNEISDGSRIFLALASSIVIQGHHGSLKNRGTYLTNLQHFKREEIFSRQIESLRQGNIEES